jgi:hypothetical protein
MGARTLALAIVLALSSLVLATPASAGANWCEGDPVFSVGGNVIDVSTSFSSEDLDSAGPLSFELLVPSNAVFPLVLSVDGSVPVHGTISRTLPAYDGLFSMPAVLRVSMDTSDSFTTYTRITGVTKWGWRMTLMNTVAGSSTTVQQYRFYLPLF